jgi:hypothetical protein
MADTVDTEASLSPADEAEKPEGSAPPQETEKPQDAAQPNEPEQPEHGAPPPKPEQPQDAAPPDGLKKAASADEAEEPEEAGSDGRGDEPEGPEDEDEELEDAQPLTELFEQLGRDLTELGKSETQLEAARNLPEVRRSARDLAGALIVVLAGLTAFAFLNVAALDALSTTLTTWLAALVIAAVWLAIGGVLLFGLMGRARRWLLWLLVKKPSTRAVDELERERDAAAKAARSTIELLGPALLIRIALAAVPDASDVADGVIDAGEDVLEASDEIVAEFTEELPGGGAVRQVWGVALMPGRLGIRVATSVLRRGKPAG